MFGMIISLVILVATSAIFGHTFGLYRFQKSQNWLVSKAPVFYTGAVMLGAVANIVFQFSVFMSERGYLW